MKKEVQSVVDFLSNLMNKRKVANSEKLNEFAEGFENVLCSHYENHWFPEKPFKGSGYRCMRIVNSTMDPLIARAGASVGLSEQELLAMLPSELTLWVDPEEVSYRIGEEGSIGVLFDAQSDNSQSSSSDTDSDTSSLGSLSSSPAPHEYVHHHHIPQPFTDHNMQHTYSQIPLQTQDPTFMNHWGDYLATFVAS